MKYKDVLLRKVMPTLIIKAQSGALLAILLDPIDFFLFFPLVVLHCPPALHGPFPLIGVWSVLIAYIPNQ